MEHKKSQRKFVNASQALKATKSKQNIAVEENITVFNNEWEVLDKLGEGKTARVYLCQHLKNPSKQVALKLLKQEFLSVGKSNIKAVEDEITILRNLEHNNITKIVGYGTDGKVVKPSGKEIPKLVYIMLEYVEGGLFFDMVKAANGLSEKHGRFFLNQLLDVLSYLSKKRVAHRDLKLENILIDENLNLKVVDFGFATCKHFTKLDEFVGTPTYMAPEIKEGKTYDGRQIDMFSVGVILFVIIQGIFPFSEAKKGEYYYKHIISGNHKQYWKETGGESLSDDFKDLILKMLHYDPDQRPNVEEVRNHPWMKNEEEHVDEQSIKIRKDIQQINQENNFEKTTQDSESDCAQFQEDKSRTQSE